MYKGKTPQKLVIPPPNLDPETAMSAYTAKKRKNAFLTQSKKLSNDQQITQNHTELINYIDTLEQKVHSIIQSHDTQFLLAYKNHLHRVREQMQELKNKNAKQANSSSNHTQKIQILEKELIIFREESLKLFDKMTEKDKQIQLLKMKVYELETDQKFSQKTINNLMRRNKYLEGMAKQYDLNKTTTQFERNEQTQKKKSHSFLEVNTLRKYASQQKRASRNIGLYTAGDSSILYKKGQILPNAEKESRPTTTALGTKRNSISMYSQKNTMSVNESFAKTLTQMTKKG